MEPIIVKVLTPVVFVTVALTSVARAADPSTSLPAEPLCPTEGTLSKPLEICSPPTGGAASPARSESRCGSLSQGPSRAAFSGAADKASKSAEAGAVV